jgi:hypothetical protein
MTVFMICTDHGCAEALKNNVADYESSKATTITAFTAIKAFFYKQQKHCCL